MSLYLAFEWVVIAVLLLASLRVVWRNIIQPMLQRPKAGCGSGCNQCGTSATPLKRG